MVVPDGEPVGEALRAALADGVDVVLTSGGTGVTPTDRTPEVTRALLDYEIPGIAEAIRAYSRDRVPTVGAVPGAGRGGRPDAGGQPARLDAAAPGTAWPCSGRSSATPSTSCAAATTDRSRRSTHGDRLRAQARGRRVRPDEARPVSTETAPTADRVVAPPPAGWEEARSRVYAVGLAAALPAVARPLADADGLTLAEPLTTRTDLPAFPTSSVDGWAVRGAGPWRVVGRVLAGSTPAPLADDGTTVEIATGAMVPAGHDRRAARSRSPRVDRTAWSAGTPRPTPEWRRARRGGVRRRGAAAGRHAGRPGGDRAGRLLRARHAAGPPGAARRAAGLRRRTAHRGPARRRAGSATRSARRCRPGCAATAATSRPSDVVGPVADTLAAHVAALRRALADADLVCTTGGTMHGPVDHLHPALDALGADYVVNTVAVRPGFPMLLARLAGADGRVRFVAGLPGNPQSAIVALVSLVAPLLAGLHGPRAAGAAAGRRWPRRSPAAATTPTWPWSGWTGPPAPPIRCGTSARRCCAGWPARTGSP